MVGLPCEARREDSEKVRMKEDLGMDVDPVSEVSVDTVYVDPKAVCVVYEGEGPGDTRIELAAGYQLSCKYGLEKVREVLSPYVRLLRLTKDIYVNPEKVEYMWQCLEAGRDEIDTTRVRMASGAEVEVPGLVKEVADKVIGGRAF